MKIKKGYSRVLHRRDDALCLLFQIVTSQVGVDNILTGDGWIESLAVEHISFDDLGV